MQVTHVFHSGFFVETAQADFLFDWWKGTLPARTGHRKPFYAFVSHSHGDHYNPDIFGLDADAWLLSWDIKPLIDERFPGLTDRRRLFFLRPHQSLMSDAFASSEASQASILQNALGMSQGSLAPSTLFSVYTLASNDRGVAFVVRTPEGSLYHAGDLNNWWWDGDADDQRLAHFYHDELSRIKGTHFAAAMIPYDLRLKEPGYGIRDFLRYCSTDAIYPMHENADLASAKHVFANDPLMKGVQNVYF